MSNLRIGTIKSLEHLNSAAIALQGPFIQALLDCYDHCGQNFTQSMRAQNIQSFLISRAEGILSEHGVFTLHQQGPRRPAEVTWISCPTPLGEELVHVNIVKPMDGNRYQLTRDNTTAIRRELDPILLEMPAEDGFTDVMIGTQVSVLNKNRKVHEPIALRISCSFLGGWLNWQERVFYAQDVIPILIADFDGENGSGKGDLTPTGPRPDLRRVH